LHQALGRHARQQSRRRGALERRRGTEHGDGGEDLRCGEPAGETAPCQKYRGERRAKLANLHHSFARIAIRDMPGDKDQGRGRDELREPDHAQSEGAAGQSIDLPSNRDGCDLIGKF
jgi:hypothetical protein